MKCLLATSDYQTSVAIRWLPGDAPPPVRLVKGGISLADREPRICGRQVRRGISLLEVLISMFVLLFGLMGVAAIFPVGNHYAGRGDQFERGAALADAAFAQLKARGLLRPDQWLYADLPADAAPAMPGDYRLIQTRPPAVQPNWEAGAPPSYRPGFFNFAGNGGAGHAFVIDPLGVSEARADLRTNDLQDKIRDADVFPFARFDSYTPDGSIQGDLSRASNVQNPWGRDAGGPLDDERWPIRRLTVGGDRLIEPRQEPRVAEAIVTLPDDLATHLPRETDRPSAQLWAAADPNGTPDYPADDTLLAREFAGNYSWLATVVPTTAMGVAALQPAHPLYGSELYEVSVAVFYKRVAVPGADTERAIEAALNPGGELVIFAPNNAIDVVDAACDGIRPGNWIALAGVHPVNGRLLLKWYRLLSFDGETQENSSIAGTSGNLAVRRAMLDGPDWPRNPTNQYQSAPVQNLRAILLPGVIGVSTQYLPMEPTGQ